MLRWTVLLAFLFALSANPLAADIIIDDFETAFASGTMIATTGTTDTDTTPGLSGSILGTERNSVLTNVSGSPMTAEALGSSTGVLAYSEGATSVGDLTLTWDGTTGSPLSIDLTGGGTNTEIVVALLSADVTGGTIDITLTDADSSFTVSKPIPVTGSPILIDFTFPEFTGISGSITSITMKIDGAATLDASIDYVAAVPEPCTTALLGIAAVGGILRQRRRRNAVVDAKTAA